MEKKTAIKKIKHMQLLTKLFVRKKTVANERYINTRHGSVRVLEYGFDSSEIQPLFIDIHGGGYALLFPEYDEKINLDIQKQANIKLISVDYPKAPQNPYPAGVEATYDVVQHYADNAKKYCIDCNSIGIGGYSSGANFATVICIMANEKKTFKIKYQIMCYPPTDAVENPYIKPNSTKPLSNKDIERFVVCYLLDPTQAKLPYVSPVYATKEQLYGLPPALMIIAGKDPLRPEGLRYGKKLKEYGVLLELHEFDNAAHGFIHSKKQAAIEARKIIINFIIKHNQFDVEIVNATIS